MISCLNGRTAWRLNSNFKLTQNLYTRTNKNRNNVENRARTTSKPIATPTTTTARTRTQTREPGKYREPKIILKPFGESEIYPTLQK